MDFLFRSGIAFLAVLWSVLVAIESIDPTTKWLAATTALAITGGLIAQIVLQVMAKMDAIKAQHMAEKTAVEVKGATEKVAEDLRNSTVAVSAKAEEVKSALDANTAATEAKLDIITKVADATHVLVNSNMSAQLKISAIALRRIADMTKDPGDAKAAELAEKVLSEHEAKQGVVDMKAGGGK